MWVPPSIKCSKTVDIINLSNGCLLQTLNDSYDMDSSIFMFFFCLSILKRLLFPLLTSSVFFTSPHTESAPASSSAVMTATSCKDPRVSPASESPTHWLRGATTGPSAEVSPSRQLPASHVGTLNPQILYPKSHLNDIDCANRK